MGKLKCQGRGAAHDIVTIEYSVYGNTTARYLRRSRTYVVRDGKLVPFVS